MNKVDILPDMFDYTVVWGYPCPVNILSASMVGGAASAVVGDVEC